MYFYFGVRAPWLESLKQFKIERVLSLR